MTATNVLFGYSYLTMLLIVTYHAIYQQQLLLTDTFTQRYTQASMQKATCSVSFPVPRDHLCIRHHLPQLVIATAVLDGRRPKLLFGAVTKVSCVQKQFEPGGGVLSFFGSIFFFPFLGHMW